MGVWGDAGPGNQGKKGAWLEWSERGQERREGALQNRWHRAVLGKDF